MRTCDRVAAWLMALVVLGGVSGCQIRESSDGPVQGRAFNPRDLAKSDVDLVVEVHMSQSMDYLRELARKLYLRNPRQLQGRTRAAALAQLFDEQRPATLAMLGHRRSIDALHLAFEPAFERDRVQALIEGLRSMLLDAYGGKQEFYLLDELDPQKIYYLARNFEIAFWKLGHDHMADGALYLISNELEGDLTNLSFERLYGKLIALQDGLAQIIADASKRHIKNVFLGVASLVFFPI